MYQFGLLKSAAFDIPTIGIGNLAVGGTGKTPHTAYIASTLIEKEQKIAILSKGYGRNTKDFKYVEINNSPEKVGDEPLQAKNNFENQIIAVDHDRVNGVLQLLYDHPNINCILLDDSFQHRKIKLGFNILLTQYNNLFYNDYILPVGLLREARINKNRANCIIITKCPENITEKKANEIQEKLNFNGEVYFSKYKYCDEIQPLNVSEKSIKLKDIQNVLLVTGIANEQPIIDLLKLKDISINKLSFRDHHKYTKRDIEKIKKLFDTFASELIVLTTEKDAQKLKQFKELNKLPVFYIKIKIEFIWNKNIFDNKIIDYVRKHQKNS